MSSASDFLKWATVFKLIAQGSNVKASCYAGTISNLVGVYNNGTAGVGATITLTATGVFTCDGVTPPVGSRIYVLNQLSSIQNGIYNLTTSAVGVSAVLTRAVDYNNSASGLVTQGLQASILNGSTLANTTWILTTDNPIVLGTSQLLYSKVTTQPEFSPYLVSNDASKTPYTSIQQAFNAAASVATQTNVQIVYLYPEQFNQNLNINAPWVFLSVIPNAGSTQGGCVINGNVVCNINGYIKITGIKFQSPNATIAFYNTGVTAANLEVIGCTFTGNLLNPGFVSDNLVTSFIPRNTIFNSVDSSISICEITGGNINGFDCEFYGQMSALKFTKSNAFFPSSLMVGGYLWVDGDNQSVSNQVSFLGKVDVSGAIEAVKMFNNAIVDLANSVIVSNASSSFWATGNGTVVAAAITLAGTAQQIDPALNFLSYPLLVSNLSLDGGNTTAPLLPGGVQTFSGLNVDTQLPALTSLIVLISASVPGLNIRLPANNGSPFVPPGLPVWFLCGGTQPFNLLDSSGNFVYVVQPTDKQFFVVYTNRSARGFPFAQSFVTALNDLTGNLTLPILQFNNETAGIDINIFPNNAYYINASTLTVCHLDGGAQPGDVYRLTNLGPGGFSIVQGGSQIILVGNRTTTAGPTGTILSTDLGDSITFECYIAGTVFVTSEFIGNLDVI